MFNIGTMFYNIEKYPELINIKNNISNIYTELSDAIEKDNTVNSILNPKDPNIEHYTNYWVKDNGFHTGQIGYDIRDDVSAYATMAIFKKDFPIKHFEAELLFPKTLALVKSISNVHYSAFFKMYPKAKLNAHTHNRKHLIFHLLLNDLKNGEFYLRCGENSKTLKNKGDCLLFDYSIEHESINYSDTERLHLVIDFNPFTEE